MLMSRCHSVLTVLRRRGRAPTERADRYLTMLVVLVREVMLQTPPPLLQRRELYRALCHGGGAAGLALSHDPGSDGGQ